MKFSEFIFDLSLLKTIKNDKKVVYCPRDPRGCDVARKATWQSGGVRPPSPPRHDITAPEELVCARGSIRLSLFLYFFIMNF